jgi:hypothetical protein
LFPGFQSGILDNPSSTSGSQNLTHLLQRSQLLLVFIHPAVGVVPGSVSPSIREAWFTVSPMTLKSTRRSNEGNKKSIRFDF